MPKPVEFRKEIRSKVSVQRYGKKESIDGVRVIELRRFVDEGGSFLEIGRLDEQAVLKDAGITVRQVSFSMMEPGAIKAWHLHRTQTDVVFVPPEGRVLAGLFDARHGSRTAEVRQRIVLGAGRAIILVIPPGVAHGFANLTSTTQPMVYLVDVQFDPDDPDEHRLPWDHLGPDFWRIPPG